MASLINNMAVNEEELAIAVQRFPVIFDKSNKDFHRKDIKKNAWRAVAEELGLGNGEEAEKAFQRLRDKYARAKKTMKAKSKSGTSSKAVTKAKAKLESLRFMQWLDDFIKPRKAKNNLEAEVENGDTEIETDSSEESLADLQLPLGNLDLQLPKEFSDDEEKSVIVKREIDRPKPSKKTPESTEKRPMQGKRKISKSTVDVETEKMNMLRSVAAAANKTSDEYDIFGQYVASKLRKLSEVLTEEAIELVEFNITSALMKARNQNALLTPNPMGLPSQTDNSFSYLNMLNS